MHTQGLTATAELSACYGDTAEFMTDTPAIKDRFATMPMLIALPTYQLPGEEELYTSFEQAISDRLLVLNKQLSLRSSPFSRTRGPELHSGSFGELDQPSSMSGSLPATVSLPGDVVKLLPASPANAWRRIILFACFALMLMLVGFNLMGLLVLFVH